MPTRSGFLQIFDLFADRNGLTGLFELLEG